MEFDEQILFAVDACSRFYRTNCCNALCLWPKFLHRFTLQQFALFPVSALRLASEQCGALLGRQAI